MEETISQYIELVLQREPISGEAEGWALLVDNGELTLDQVRQSIIDSAEASTDVYPVILAYQAIYGRVPDANGLNYWVNVYRGVQDLDNPNTPTQNEAMVAILRAFVDPEKTPEFVDRFGPNPTADQFVTLSYKNVLDRVPDQSGQLYWTNRYNQVLEDLEAAHPDWSTEQLNVEVRAIILEQFVSSQEYSESADAAIDGFLNAVALGEDGAHSGSLWSFSGDTLTLTTDADNYTGTDGNDTFDAPLSSGAGGLVAQQTLQGFDTLDGGEGHDTLNAALNGFDALFGAHDPSISNIEQYNLTVREEGADGGLDLANASGYEVLQNIDSRGDLFLENVNVSESGDAPVIALTNVRGDTEVTYDDEVDSVSVQNVTANKVGLHDNDADLRIDVDNGRIETLNLTVSNGVYLDLEGDAARIENLNISGSGVLELEGSGDFQNLVALNSTGYSGDLDLDVTGSEVLETINTGVGNDRIVVDNDVVNGGLSVNMNGGLNTLALETDPWWGDFDEGDIDNLDFIGGVENVQVLEFTQEVDLGGAATLDLDGFDAELSTVLFGDGLDGNGNELTVDSPNADLTLASDGDFEDVDLHTVGITNLIVDVNEGDLDIDNLSGAELETLTLNQEHTTGFAFSALDITSDAGHDVSNLKTITSTATGNASVEIDATSADANVGSLTSVGVISTGGDATLNLTGRAGVAFVAGVQQQQLFSINVTGAGGFPNATSAGNVGFTSESLPGGTTTIAYATGPYFLGSNTDPRHDIGAANDMAAGLSAIDGLTATSDLLTNEFLVTWDEFGTFDPLVYQSLLSGGTTGTLNSVNDSGIVTVGVEQIEMEAGNGFEALETATVVAEDDAYVNLTDVYGAVALDVTAGTALGNNAYINLYNTEVTSVTAAAYHVDIDTAGDTVGNGSLTTITVMSATANITLEDNMSSFQTLDVKGVSTNLIVDTSGAGFEVDPGMYVEYLLGATETVAFTGNDVREVYAFDGTDIGDVIITDFTAGADPISGDRLDLSEFGITGQAGLIFTQVGANLEITDLGADDFAGTITLIGVNAADIGFNIIYA